MLPNPQMQPTGRSVPSSARALIAVGDQWNKRLRGRGLEGLQLICISLGRGTPVRGDLMFPRGLALLLPVLLLAACGGEAPQPPIQIHRLPSGEEVKVLGIGRMNFSESGPALMLKYQTDLDMDDTSALHAEAQRIWAEFRKDAEQAQVESAIVSANAATTGGIISRGRAFNFVYERSGDGSWREVRK